MSSARYKEQQKVGKSIRRLDPGPEGQQLHFISAKSFPFRIMSSDSQNF